MSGGVHPEVWLAVGYAGFLAAAAGVLEMLARHTQRRAEQYRLAGFKYHAHLDAYECPTGQRLHRHAHASQGRVAHYRAPAHACNCCTMKARCTDSDAGREVTRYSFSWLETEVGRFHRGMSLALVLLAQFILGVELLRFDSLPDRGLVAGVLLVLALSWLRMLGKFRAQAASAVEDEGFGQRGLKARP